MRRLPDGRATLAVRQLQLLLGPRDCRDRSRGLRLEGKGAIMPRAGTTRTIVTDAQGGKRPFAAAGLNGREALKRAFTAP